MHEGSEELYALYLMLMALEISVPHVWLTAAQVSGRARMEPG